MRLHRLPRGSNEVKLSKNRRHPDKKLSGLFNLLGAISPAGDRRADGAFERYPPSGVAAARFLPARVMSWRRAGGRVGLLG